MSNVMYVFFGICQSNIETTWMKVCMLRMTSTCITWNVNCVNLFSTQENVIVTAKGDVRC